MLSALENAALLSNTESLVFSRIATLSSVQVTVGQDRGINYTVA